jgi:hypothetical protein
LQTPKELYQTWRLSKQGRRRKGTAKKEAAELRPTAAEQRQEVVRSKATLQALQDRLNKLSISALGTTAGGFDFERWVYDFMDFCEIENRRPYRSDDKRQVDGSVSLDANALQGCNTASTAAFVASRQGIFACDRFRWLSAQRHTK